MTSPEAGASGGCQCGAVRFHVGRLGRSTICHCRMCQKAFGGFFGPLVTSRDVSWTRGEPQWFHSSNLARRAFCARCGTPLGYETRYGLELAVGAFDDPTVAASVLQVNMRDKLPFFDGLTALPVKTDPSAEWLEFLGDVRSYQHPDHDTDRWPMEQR
jgi:hypothetical protein